MASLPFVKMGVDKKVEDVWEFIERKETKGRAVFSDNRGKIVVSYDHKAGLAVIEVVRTVDKQSISQRTEFEKGEQKEVAYIDDTRGKFPLLEDYVQKKTGGMARAFIEELRLLELEGIVDYERIKNL